MLHSKLKKILSSVMLMVFMLNILPSIHVFADDTGSCGENVTYSFDKSSGELTISGNGKMKDYSRDNKRLWDSYIDSIKKVTIKNGVTTIGDYAFYDCSSLKSITIPSSVTSIGKRAFSRCSGLKAINVDGSNTKYKSIDGILFSKDGTQLVTYPAGKKDTSYTILSSVTSIGYWAFSDCSGLTQATIPQSVTSIGNDAFSGCIGLTTVEYSGNKEPKHSYDIFNNCRNLKNVTVPADYVSKYFCEIPAVITSSVVQKVLGSENLYIDKEGRTYELKDDAMVLVNRSIAPKFVSIEEQTEEITQEDDALPIRQYEVKIV